MKISNKTENLLADLIRMLRKNPKRAEVHRHVDIFFDSLDGITEEQADWELDLLQDAVLSIMTDARKE